MDLGLTLLIVASCRAHGGKEAPDLGGEMLGLARQFRGRAEYLARRRARLVGCAATPVMLTAGWIGDDSTMGLDHLRRNVRSEVENGIAAHPK